MCITTKNFFYWGKKRFLLNFPWHSEVFFIQSLCCFLKMFALKWKTISYLRKILMHQDCFESRSWKNKKVQRKGGAFPWRWHISLKSVLVQRFTASGQEWVLAAEEKFWRPDAQKEERYCPHSRRGHSNVAFFVLFLKGVSRIHELHSSLERLSGGFVYCDIFWELKEKSPVPVCL